MSHDPALRALLRRCSTPALLLLLAACGSDAAVEGPAIVPGGDASADSGAVADAGPDGSSDAPGGTDAADDAPAPADVAGTDVDQPDGVEIDVPPPDAGCSDASQCPQGDVPCQQAACIQGQCGFEPSADGSACDDGNACTAETTCAGGQCLGGSGTCPCEAAGDCSDGNPCTVDTCDPQQAICVFAAQPGAACDDGDACTAGDTCAASGQCLAGGAVACDDGNPCTQDTCDAATGACAYAAAGGGACNDQDPCTDSDVCAANGACQGTAKTCDDGNPCTQDSCDAAAGGCVAQPAAGTCDDGNPCTEGDTCASGKCAAGLPKLCDDGNPCTDDVCVPPQAGNANGGQGCTTANNTAACSDAAKCLSGKCNAGKCELDGASGCADNNPCTADTCIDGKCVFAPVAEATPCAAADQCVQKAACSAGACKPTQALDCDDGNGCTTDACDPSVGCVWKSVLGAPCDDGDKCTTGDSCQGVKCLPGKALDPTTVCEDGNPCTIGGCDPKLGCKQTLSTAPCDDGNLCTQGDVCAGGKCTSGGLAKCDDGKTCTTDACDQNTGACASTPLADGAPCDDGNACTTSSTCQAGSCVGGPQPSCDDNQPCTQDKCDPATGKCLFTPASGQPCTDGNACTANDLCASGKCAPGPQAPCNDGDPCTKDACDPTKGCVATPIPNCGGCKVAADCNDANPCTTDTCAATGKCAFAPAQGPCDAGDKCTYGDQCDAAGKCVQGSSLKCDDGNACTVDSCNPATGACAFKAAADGGACSDGLACTTGDVCKAGKCAPAVVDCPLYKETFECGTGGQGWTLEKPQGKNVLWAVDQTPVVPDQAKYGCTLNFNDGTDYCDPAGNGCQTPTGAALSPVIDATQNFGNLRIKFNAFYQLDGGNQDVPRVRFRNADTNAVVHQFWLSKSSQNVNVWRTLEVAIPVLAGSKFRVELALDNASGWGGNDGKGWFMDNFVVDQVPVAENCADGLDNDGNGKLDCEDPACIATNACTEDCGNGKDDDFNDQVDCQDTKCAGATDCLTPFAKWDFDCNAGGWSFSDGGNNVSWAIDATPASVKPYTGACTLNYNNGSNYCGVSNCDGPFNWSAGTATLQQEVDAAGFSKVLLAFRSYLAVDTSNQEDQPYVQISTDGFSGCCGGTNQCSSSAPNNCNTAGTQTFPVSKGTQKQWVKAELDASKVAGKKFKIRFRFNSVSSQNNNNPGWFVDDLRVYGTK